MSAAGAASQNLLMEEVAAPAAADIRHARPALPTKKRDALTYGIVSKLR